MPSLSSGMRRSCRCASVAKIVRPEFAPVTASRPSRSLSLTSLITDSRSHARSAYDGSWDLEGIEQVETDSWNNEQVHGGDVRRVVTQEGSPSLAGWPPSFDHVLGDA